MQSIIASNYTDPGDNFTLSSQRERWDRRKQINIDDVIELISSKGVGFGFKGALATGSVITAIGAITLLDMSGYDIFHLNDNFNAFYTGLQPYLNSPLSAVKDLPGIIAENKTLSFITAGTSLALAGVVHKLNSNYTDKNLDALWGSGLMLDTLSYTSDKEAEFGRMLFGKFLEFKGDAVKTINALKDHFKDSLSEIRDAILESGRSAITKLEDKAYKFQGDLVDAAKSTNDEIIELSKNISAETLSIKDSVLLALKESTLIFYEANIKPLATMAADNAQHASESIADKIATFREKTFEKNDNLIKPGK